MVHSAGRLWAGTPIRSMAILRQDTMANFNKIAIMAVLVWDDVAINMVNIGVYAKIKNNADNMQK